MSMFSMAVGRSQSGLATVASKLLVVVVLVGSFVGGGWLAAKVLFLLVEMFVAVEVLPCRQAVLDVEQVAVVRLVLLHCEKGGLGVL